MNPDQKTELEKEIKEQRRWKCDHKEHIAHTDICVKCLWEYGKEVDQKDALIRELANGIAEIRDIIDGEVDIDNNGNPNQAMKVDYIAHGLLTRPDVKAIVDVKKEAQ